MRNPRRKLNATSGRLLVLAAASLLLSSCALLEKEEPVAPPAPAAVPAPATTPPPAGNAGLPEETTDNSELTDAINRDGRIIQLGSFVEQAPAVQPPANNVVELNYEQEDLRLVLEELGSALNLNMVIDPTIDNKVSIRTAANNPLRYEDIWPLMRMLARNAGVTIEQVGNVYRFSRNASNIPTEIVLPGGLDNATSPEVLQVTPLTYISIEAAEAVLNPLLQPAGSIIRLGPANLLGIIGSPEQLERINALLAVMDDDPFQNQGIQVYQLQNSKASEVAEELTSVLQLIEGEQTAYQVLGLDRINAVMVIAPATRGFAEVTNWVRILDAASQEQVEQLFVYKVKSLNAVTLAETLTSVFGEEDEEAQQQAAREQDQSPPGDLINRAVPDAVPFNQPAPIVEAPETQTGAGLESAAVSADISVSIVSDEDTNSLLIRASPREYRQLLTTISTLDVAPAQVLINAVIGQATLTDSTQFGIDWTRVSGNLASDGIVSSAFLPPLTSNRVVAGVTVPGANSGLVFTKSFMDGSAVIDATLRAISLDTDVRLLARPTILATNNQEGEIKVGQAVPVNNGTDTNANGTTSSNIAYRDVGIVLTITPHINADGYINLEIFQSLSSIEGGDGVGGNPVFANQEITTTAVVLDQSTITLGGLIQEQDGDRNSGIPVLNKIPVLGALFSYQSYNNDRRELFVILHPQIVTNDSAGTAVMQEYRAKFTMLGNMLEEAGL